MADSYAPGKKSFAEGGLVAPSMSVPSPLLPGEYWLPAETLRVPGERQPVGGDLHGWLGEYNRGWNECRAAVLAAVFQRLVSETIRLEDIAAMKDELAKIAVAVGRSKTDGHDCDWFELSEDVAALAAGIPKGWSLCRLHNSNEIIVVSAPDGISVTLSPQGTGLASQLLYQLATTLVGEQKS